MQDGILLYKGRVVVPNVDQVKEKFLQYLHDDPTSGHGGVTRTLQKAYNEVFWPGLKADIYRYVTSCKVCQECKHDNTKPSGLLNPFPIPSETWQHISMDFVEGLPKSQGYSVLWVIVDRLSKYAHFIPLKHPYTANSLAQVFMQEIYRLHGMPKTMVSDRDPIFTSNLWKEIFNLMRSTLSYNTVYHPQSDGQTEILNKGLETYLRCFCSEKPKNWAHWLYLAEWSYNITYHSATTLSPYQAIYGKEPPTLSSYLKTNALSHNLKDWTNERAEIIHVLKTHLLHAQDRIRKYADPKRKDVSFQLGDWVYLKLQPYKQQSTVQRNNLKLSQRFYGPYKIVGQVGLMAYRLDLPTSSLIHPVFHVSQLKNVIKRDSVVLTGAPYTNSKGELLPTPLSILASKIDVRRGRKITRVLVQWEGQESSVATWETWYKLKQAYPHLEDKLISQEGGNCNDPSVTNTQEQTQRKSLNTSNTREGETQTQKRDIVTYQRRRRKIADTLQMLVVEPSSLEKGWEHSSHAKKEESLEGLQSIKGEEEEEARDRKLTGGVAPPRVNSELLGFGSTGGDVERERELF